MNDSRNNVRSNYLLIVQRTYLDFTTYSHLKLELVLSMKKTVLAWTKYILCTT